MRGLDRTFAAVVLGWNGTAVTSRRTSARGVRALLERLAAIGVHAVVVSEAGVDEIDDQLRARPTGPGELLLVPPGAEMFAVTAAGPRPLPRSARWAEPGTDWSGSMHAVLRRLASHGVTGDLVLVVGNEFGEVDDVPGRDSRLLVPEATGATVVSVGAEPAGVPRGVLHLGGGPATVRALLSEQLRRARTLRVPSICRDPGWTIVETGVDVGRHRVSESLFTLTSDGVGLRGSVEETPGFGQPLVVANGVYAGTGPHDGLLPGPDLIDVEVDPRISEDVRILDLRTGVLLREERDGPTPPLRSLRFGSLVEPGVFAVRIEAGQGRLRPASSGTPGRPTWTTTTGPGGGIGSLARQSVRRNGDIVALERLVATDATPRGRPSRMRAGRRLTHAASTGFERLLAGQRAEWARRWDTVGVSIPDDPSSELALRFALFQLWSLGGGRESAVGARGLTGAGYAGHVFWDADVFVLPALVTVDPRGAAAMVAYRLARLDAARHLARAGGRRGARFPWESGETGHDVTPDTGYVGGDRVPILTGTLEEHITADVAWAVVRHALWTRTPFSLTPAEQGLLADTARYWESRVRIDGHGDAHIDGVIGPDEYHEHVDDNAFTNGMARWNLRTAACWAGDAPDRERWLDLAGRLPDGYDGASGLYEQFRGYFGLDPVLITDLADPPVAADVLLGRERVAASQVIKQPDVLMLHHLIPEDTRPGSLRANLDFYGPRTACGSSLALSVMALLEARAARPDRALDLLRASLRIDLDDVGGTTAAGLHTGAAGGAWQGLLLGFLGAEVRDAVLHLRPVLPEAWPRLEVRFRCLGSDVRVRVEKNAVSVDSTERLLVHLDAHGREPRTSGAVELLQGEER